MYRQGISALIINRKKNFLVVHLTSFKEGHYAIPGGGLEKGETLEQAAYREIYEELGINNKSLILVGKSNKTICYKLRTKIVRNGVEYTGTQRTFLGFQFIGLNKEIVPQDIEIGAFKWVSYEDLEKYLLFELQAEQTKEQIHEIFPFFIHH